MKMMKVQQKKGTRKNFVSFSKWLEVVPFCMSKEISYKQAYVQPPRIPYYKLITVGIRKSEKKVR